MLRTTEKNHLKAITPFLDSIQAFMDEHIKGAKGMSSLEVASQWREKHDCNLKIEVIKIGILAAIKIDKIVNFASKKKAGIVHKESYNKEKGEFAKPVDESKFTIKIDEKVSLVKVDEMNWALLVNGHNEGWYPDASKAMEGLARKVLEHKLTTSVKSANFEEMKRLIEKAAKEVVQAIKAA